MQAAGLEASRQGRPVADACQSGLDPIVPFRSLGPWSSPFGTAGELPTLHRLAEQVCRAYQEHMQILLRRQLHQALELQSGAPVDKSQTKACGCKMELVSRR